MPEIAKTIIQDLIADLCVFVACHFSKMKKNNNDVYAKILHTEMPK